MQFLHYPIKRKSVTFIEVIIDVALLSILSLVVITSLLDSLKTVKQSGVLSAAGQLANEHMEELRNLPYDSLATEHGPIFPQGILLDDVSVTRSGKQFSIHTDIRYIDDEFDGLAGSGSNLDTNPADYKKITVTIYDSNTNKQLAILSTDISSRAAETSSSTGVLKISVLDASGDPVSGASVTITNSVTNPAILITSTTSADGLLTIPNLPPSSGYHITATKTGMSTDSTNAVTTSLPQPSNPDATVLLQQVTSTTLSIDQLSTINLTANGLGTSTPTLSLIGKKLIGTNPDTPKTNQSIVLLPTTLIGNMEFDSYSFVNTNGWYVKVCDPMQPFLVNPNTTAQQTCTFTEDSTDIQIQTITPRQTTAVSDITITITGINLTDATVFFQLQGGGNPEIPVTGLIADATGNTLDGTVDFSSYASGTYQLILRNALGKETIQTNALVIQ